MTLDELCEMRVLSSMTRDTRKFAIEIGYRFRGNNEQFALERLQLRDWIRLIDVSPVAELPGRIMRVFRVMPEAVEWYEKHRADMILDDQRYDGGM